LTAIGVDPGDLGLACLQPMVASPLMSVRSRRTSPVSPTASSRSSSTENANVGPEHRLADRLQLALEILRLKKS